VSFELLGGLFDFGPAQTVNLIANLGHLIASVIGHSLQLTEAVMNLLSRGQAESEHDQHGGDGQLKESQHGEQDATHRLTLDER
jgi:hypothetical protein